MDACIDTERNWNEGCVIGGNGQVGNYLLPMLVREGHEVTCICRSDKGYFRGDPEFEQVQEVRLARGTKDFEREVAKLRCDVIVDMICFTKAQAQKLVTTLGESVRHYVAVGSIWIHGAATYTPLKEDECRTPTDVYGINKLDLTDYLKEEWLSSRFPSTVVHPGHIIAPGHSAIVGPQANRNLEIIEALRDGRKVALPNFGLETLHHVHAADVAGIIDAAIRTGDSTFGEEYHAVSERAITLRGFCEEVAALYGRRAELTFMPFEELAKTLEPQDAADTLEHISRSPSCSAQKAALELGYMTRTTMAAVEEHLRAIGML